MQYSSVGKRIGGGVIDIIVVWVITFVIGMATGNTDGASVSLSGGVAVLNFVIWLGYFVGLEATQGATVGKMALGMKVVDADGNNIAMGASVIRNLLRIVDYLFCGIVGIVLIATSDQRQRLGDRVATTFVIDK